MGSTSEGLLLERAAELDALRDAILAGGRLILVSGEAGIGKTALIRHFSETLAPRVSILSGACDSLFTPRPLGPLLELAASTGGELKALVDGEARPHEVAGALLGELRGRAPSVLVLEDLHWADEATLDVVRLVSRRIEPMHTVVVLTYRDDQLAANHPLRIMLGELPGRGPIVRLELAGLSCAAVRRLGETSALDPDDLYARTRGNPFFVTESIAAGADRVPASIRDAVLSRIAHLSPDARALLDAVAVVPQRSEVWLLEALTNGSLAPLDECLTSGVLRTEADGVAFRHELARLVVQDALVPDHAVALHRRALAVLADPSVTAPDLARLAHHAEAAGDGPAVLRYAPAAGERAAALGSPREAQHHYWRALRFAEGIEPMQRARLLEGFAEHAYLSDMRAEAADAITEAIAIHRRRGDIVRQGDLVRRRARLLSCIGRAPEALVCVREAVKLLEQAAPSIELARAYSALAGLSMLTRDPAPTLEWGARAITLAEQLGDREALVHALNNVGVVEMALGRAEGEAKLAESLALSREAGLGTDAGRAYINLGSSLTEAARWRDAEEVVAAGLDYCRELGLEAWLKCLIGMRAQIELALGLWDAAAMTARAILDGPRDQVVGPRSDALLVLALVRARRGDPEVWPLLDEALAIALDADDIQLIVPAAAARAEVAWLEGRHNATVDETDAAYALAIAHDIAPYVGELACWRRRAGVTEDVTIALPGRFKLELVGDPAGAAEAWRAAGATYHAATTIAQSDDPAALRQALDVARSLNARPLAAILARRLRTLGERAVPRGPRPTTRINAAGLTNRELEVLPLLAEGLRNSEIAERLIVSHKTVDHHVSAILRKLDVKTRGQAGAEAARLGLLEPSR